MALTDEQLQDLILTECNVIEDPTIGSKIPLYWVLWADETPAMRYWKVRRAVCDYLLGQNRNKVRRSMGTDSISEEQKFDHVLAIRKLAQSEIDKLDHLIGPGDLEISPMGSSLISIADAQRTAV